MTKPNLTLFGRSAVLGMMLATAVASSAAPLYLKASGQADQAIELGEISKITFGDNEVTVALQNGTSVSVPTASFVGIGTTSSDMSSVIDLSTADNEAVEVFNVNGVRVASGINAVKGLKAGIYIIKSSSKTVKIVIP
jgi:hypothetical protein